MADERISRRKFLGVSTAVAAGGIVAGLVIGGAAGYFGGQAGAAPATVTQIKTVTETRTATTTIGPGAPVTTTVTGPTVTSTVTGPAVTTTVTAAPTTVTRTVTQTVEVKPTIAKPTGPLSLSSIKVGNVVTTPSPTSMFAHAVADLGYAEKEGLKVEPVGFAGSAPAMRALVAGATQITAGDMLVQLRSWAAGQEVVIVGGQLIGLAHAIFAKETIKSVEDMKGTNFGIASLGSVDQVFAGVMFTRHKMSLKDVSLVQVGSPADRLRALVAGKVDATTILWDGAMEISRNYPQFRELVRANEYLPYYPNYMVITTSKFLKDHPDVVLAYLRASLKLTRDLYGKEEVYAAGLKKYMPRLTPEEVRTIWQKFRDFRIVGVNGGLNLGDLGQSLEFHYTEPALVADLAGKWKVRDLVDTKLMAQVLAEMGVVDAAWDVPDYLSGLQLKS